MYGGHSLTITAPYVDHATSVSHLSQALLLPMWGTPLHCDDELITQGRRLLGPNNEEWIQDISLHFLAVCLESLGHPREATIATIATMHTCSHHQEHFRVSMCKETYFDITSVHLTKVVKWIRESFSHTKKHLGCKHCKQSPPGSNVVLLLEVPYMVQGVTKFLNMRLARVRQWLYLSSSRIYTDRDTTFQGYSPSRRPAPPAGTKQSVSIRSDPIFRGNCEGLTRAASWQYNIACLELFYQESSSINTHI